MIHSYPFYIADWRESETRRSMSGEEKGLYRELLDYCWWEGSLPADETTLRKIADFSEKEFRRSWGKVKAQFFEVDGRLHHHKVDEGRPRLEQWREARRDAGKVGGLTRAKNLKSQAIAKAIATPPVEAIAKAIASSKPQAELKPPSSSSSSSYTSSHTSSSVASPDSFAPATQPSATGPLTQAEWNGFNLDEAFEQFKALYPKHRLSRIGLCESRFAAAFLGIQAGTESSHLAKILDPLRPGGVWAESEEWAKGYVCAAEDYLRHKRWGESPKPKPQEKRSALDRLAAGEDPEKVMDELRTEAVVNRGKRNAL